MRIERKKSLGQCFLSDIRAIEQEASLISPKGQRVLEIGPGDGRLSEHLLSAKELTLCEKDARFAAFLREKFANHPNVRIIEGDFLELEPFEVDVVAGNLPYYISSDITFTLIGWKFKRAVLMYQKEFARKLYAEGADMSRISFFAQHYFSIKEHFVVPKSAFRPMPKVDSALVELTPTYAQPIPKPTYDAITSLFQHRQKFISSSVKLYCRDSRKDATDAIQRLEKQGVDTKKRVFEFSRGEILKIGKEISK